MSKGPKERNNVVAANKSSKLEMREGRRRACAREEVPDHKGLDWHIKAKGSSRVCTK